MRKGGKLPPFAASAVKYRRQKLRNAGLSASIVGTMPKMKTHSGAKKRFRKSAKGKLIGRHAFSSHILEKKSPKRKRKFARPAAIAKSDEARVKGMLQ